MQYASILYKRSNRYAAIQIKIYRIYSYMQLQTASYRQPATDSQLQIAIYIQPATDSQLQIASYR